jgi:non-ribosomal peptide synthetase-like protein
MPSGAVDLYVAILGVLAAGAAYVPVDNDDPPERARLVLDTAGVRAVLRERNRLQLRQPARSTPAKTEQHPRPDDDAWIIFTSGSTGTPKGVAVTHRSAAAFVDAEARLFLQDAPLGPGDRVLAGLSVAFDASCEEMWLAWRHGACLVPAPRALVRSGMDLAPWLVDRGVTAVSTVPTLASLWPSDTLDAVRLLIFGGEACPPELADRLAVGDREVWNTYGPTEATVVACGARLAVGEPVRIGLPLDGWDLAVVDKDQRPVPPGEIGELIIAGVGLARYLDPVRDAERFAAMPTLGWARAYRSGDLVREDPEGLTFIGRADDQVKVGGRRIELGEVDAALLRLPGVGGAATAVRTTEAGTKVLVGYVTASDRGAGIDRAASLDLLRHNLPAALVPLLAVVDDIPTRTSGKVDRDALPWPLEQVAADGDDVPLAGTAAWLATLWARVLGTRASDPAADFFNDGGGSLSAAQLVSALRERYPHVTVADVYENPQLGQLADRLDELAPVGPADTVREVPPVPRRMQVLQQLVSVVLLVPVGARWLVWSAVVGNLLSRAGGPSWVPHTSWWVVLTGWLLLISPWGRMVLTVAIARSLMRGVRSGRYPRGGSMHLRLWAAEAAADALGAGNLAGAPWISVYARALGAKVGRGVQLQAVPPVTGLLNLGKRSSVEPEVDLSGHWLDGDVLHIGRIRVGAGASVGSRSVLLPGARVGQDAEVAPGSVIDGSVPPGELWAGSPAFRVAMAHRDWPRDRPASARRWVTIYAVTAMALACLPIISVTAGLAVLWPSLRESTSAVDAAASSLLYLLPATAVGLCLQALLTLAATRLLGLGLREGYHPVRSRIGWQVWATERLMDDARTYLYPLYASLLTPSWLRALGADVGRGVEASTVLMLPAMTVVGDQAFLADDTLIGSYELAGGWIRIERAKVGKRSFLGNSGMAAPGRVIPKNSLVAVLSAAPARAKAGTSWLGSPPVQLQRAVASDDESRTYEPPTSVRVQRGLVEVCRLLAAVASAGLGLAVVLSLLGISDRWGFVAALLLAAPVLIVVGLLAALISIAAKRVLVGRHRAVESPLWSSFVWRNELADMFVELVAVPWFVRWTLTTPLFLVWLRGLGAHIGRGVWCETYWLPEADLVTLGDGATVNRGCVLQTHLFHDRIMSMDTVTLEAGATLGPNSVILPAASLGAASVVGPSSLVLRGDHVPAGSLWTGNPIAPWT